MRRFKSIPWTLYIPVVLALLCLLLPLAMDLDPLAMDPKNRLAPPSSEMLFGADGYGRDLLARLVYGGRLSLGIAAAVTAISCGIGLLVGLYTAYFPVADKILMRIMDAFMAIPAILMALALMAVFSASAGNVILALVLVYTPGIARLVRASALKIREAEFMQVLKLAGQSNAQLIFRHLLPNVLPTLSVQATYIFAEAIISEAALSFLGAGIPAKEASWGNIISTGKLVILKAPRIILLPSLLIFILLWSLIKTGDLLKKQMRTTAPKTKLHSAATVIAPKAQATQQTVKHNLLDVQNFSLWFQNPDAPEFQAVDNVSLSLREGEVLALVGASGCGKSSLCQSILALYEPYEARHTGAIEFEGQNILEMTHNELTALRGGQIAMVFQDPETSLDPVRKVRQEFLELEKLSGMQKDFAACLKDVGIPDPKRVLESYPHELSGGLKQRVLIALALYRDPKILLADEPTTALDVSVQKELMDLFKTLKNRGLSILFVTHDLSLLKDFADRIVVMRAGRIVEQTNAATFFACPREAYSRELLAAIPPLQAARPDPPGTDVILAVKSLVKTFKVRQANVWANPFRKKVLHAVQNVSFEIRRGSCFALVGESGSGKTTSAAMIARLLQPDGGVVYWHGEPLTALPEERQREIQMIFQNATASFDPRQTMAEAFTEVEKIRGVMPSRKRQEAVLQKMHLTVDRLDKRPGEFSGGQLRRLSIARAMLLNPDFLILDESLSGLDLPVQREIIELLRELQTKEKLTYLLISHDLRAVAQLADTIGVMQNGVLVEVSDAGKFFKGPEHPYAQRLLDAVP